MEIYVESKPSQIYLHPFFLLTSTQTGWVLPRPASSFQHQRFIGELGLFYLLLFSLLEVAIGLGRVELGRPFGQTRLCLYLFIIIFLKKQFISAKRWKAFLA